jgi:hypothetical protein
MTDYFITMEGAISYARTRAERERKIMRVYHAASDQWGRDALFFVRSVDDKRPDGSVLVTEEYPT